MQILYTGATKQGAEQLDPSLSLGGYISGSVIPNGQLSNLFSQASAYSIQNKRKETKLLAIYNNEGDLLTDLFFKFSLENNSICKYKVAFVTPTMSTNGACFEQIANTNALPYYASFQDVVSDTPISIPTLATGSYLGLWITKEYDLTADELKKKTCTDWLAESEIDPPVEIDTEETLSLTIDYTVGEPSVSNSSSSSTSISL